MAKVKSKQKGITVSRQYPNFTYKFDVDPIEVSDEHLEYFKNMATTFEIVEGKTSKKTKKKGD